MEVILELAQYQRQIGIAVREAQLLFDVVPVGRPVKNKNHRILMLGQDLFRKPERRLIVLMAGKAGAKENGFADGVQVVIVQLAADIMPLLVDLFIFGIHLRSFMSFSISAFQSACRGALRRMRDMLLLTVS